MPKIERGRLDGVWGMRRFSSQELYDLANVFEGQILDPKNEDDPKWLRRWAGKLRRLADKKEKAREHKIGQGG